MTTINWQAMTDKEKTRLILIHVMGCTESDSLYALDVEKYPVAIYVDHLKTWFLEIEEEDRPIAKGFDPLHDLNDAWLIVEKMREQYDIRLLMEEDNRVRYYVQIWARSGDKMVGYGSSDISMAEAICIAAQRTQGYIIEGVQH